MFFWGYEHMWKNHCPFSAFLVQKPAEVETYELLKITVNGAIKGFFLKIIKKKSNSLLASFVVLLKQATQ